MKPKTGSTGNLLPFSKQSDEAEKPDIDYDEFYFPYSKEERKENSSSILAFIFYYLLLILVLSLFQSAESYGQTAPASLQPGDTVPLELWNLPMQVVNQPGGEKSIVLNEYKGKLIIIDFWSTYCVPCIKSLYTMDTLQKKFYKDLVVLPVTDEPEEKIRSFIQKRGWQLPSVVSQSVLNAYFPHLTVPHQVWICNNKILAITSHNEATPGHIQAILDKKKISLSRKRDIYLDAFESIQPLAEHAAVPVLSRSIITGFIKGFGRIQRMRNDSIKVINILNTSVLTMYKSVLKLPYNLVFVESREKDKYVNAHKNNQYQYCYQLFMPATADDSLVNEKVISDLNNYFSLNGHFEMRDINCLVIGKTEEQEIFNPTHPQPSLDTIPAMGFDEWIQLLNFSPKWTQGAPVFINESGFNGRIPGNLRPIDVSAIKEDLSLLCGILKPFNLTLRQEKRNIKIFVISDPSKPILN